MCMFKAVNKTQETQTQLLKLSQFKKDFSDVCL